MITCDMDHGLHQEQTNLALTFKLQSEAKFIYFTMSSVIPGHWIRIMGPVRKLKIPYVRVGTIDVNSLQERERER